MLVLASSCGSNPKPVPLAYQHPPAADLKVEQLPQAGPEIATSEPAYEAYNQDVMDWGKRGWAAVARLCRFSRSMGMSIECPAEPATAR
jgi:hypothetical protein